MVDGCLLRISMYFLDKHRFRLHSQVLFVWVLFCQLSSCIHAQLDRKRICFLLWFHHQPVLLSSLLSSFICVPFVVWNLCWRLSEHKWWNIPDYTGVMLLSVWCVSWVASVQCLSTWHSWICYSDRTSRVIFHVSPKVKMSSLVARLCWLIRCCRRWWCFVSSNLII